MAQASRLRIRFATFVLLRELRVSSERTARTGPALGFSVGITFEHPAWLLLLALAAPAIWTGLAWFASMSRIRRLSAVAARVVLIALITAMLAGASSVRRTQRLAVIGLLDVSDSVRLFGHAPPSPTPDGATEYTSLTPSRSASA